MTTTRLIITGDLYTAAAAVLIVLRLQDRIDWPWLWVLAPLWAPLTLAACAALLLALSAAAAHIAGTRQAQLE